MSYELSEVLALTEEPAILVKQGKICFANAQAQRLLGPCEGQKADALLGGEICRHHAQSYLADTTIRGTNYILRVNRMEGQRLIFLLRQEGSPVVLNDAFLYTLRSNLMTLGVAIDRLRPAAEDAGQAGMMKDLRALTSSYYKLMRLSGNASLVRDLLERRAYVNPVSVDLSLLCHAVLDALEEPFPQITLTRDIPEGVWANVDPALFKQLLFNLLSNCLCHAEASFIQVKLTETPESVVLAVNDNGRGIPSTQMYTVFDRYRYHYSMRELGGGAGFGLTAARGITQLHGGTLLLESRPDQGTSVRASFHRGTDSRKLRCAHELCSMRELLLGLADCMPIEYFREQYLD